MGIILLYGINIALGNVLTKYPNLVTFITKNLRSVRNRLSKTRRFNLVAILLTVIIIVFRSIYISDRLLTVLQYYDMIMEGLIDDIPHNNNVPNIEEKDLEMLIVASMQTLIKTW